MAYCRQLCQKIKSVKDGKKNYLDKFWCSHCDCFIPSDKAILGYGFRCPCCLRRLRTKPRRKTKQQVIYELP